MTENKETLTAVRKQLDRELNVGLGLSKAEGNLRFLSGQLDSEHSKIGITEGMAIMDALHAVQAARKAWQDMAHAKLIADRK
jgi:uncharacterized protein (DUF2164 family)|tara:strand:+ start:13 stop:258 length:246 start_codon:yes stop_codon:yes gene_type:complete